MIRSLFSFLLALGLAAPAGATSVVPFTFDAMCKTAARIAHVTCISAEPVQTADGIRTRTRFRVREGVKGAAGETIEVLLPGGKIGERRVAVAGMPTFVPGDETVLFLTGPDGLGSPWPVGLSQGCYPVVDDKGERRVRLQRGATPIPDGARFKPTTAEPYEVDLGAFLSKIREVTGGEERERRN